MARRRKRRRRKNRRMVEIYGDLERIYARKGRRSLWPDAPFVHKFQKGARVLGVAKGGMVKLREGDLVIRSKRGKKLWKHFNYKPEDVR